MGDRLYLLALAVLICGLLSGCSASTIKLDSSYDQEKQAQAPLAHKIRIISVFDERSDKESVGKLGLAYVANDDVRSWLDNAFIYRGYSVGESYRSDFCNLQIVLKLANIRSSSTSKVANVVIGVELFKSDVRHYYRGNYTAINWNSSDSEIKSALNQALALALNKIENQLDSICV